eukprot:scaffold3361_cov166-Amphora_coffeaeformis.AAC.8
MLSKEYLVAEQLAYCSGGRTDFHCDRKRPIRISRARSRHALAALLLKTCAKQWPKLFEIAGSTIVHTRRCRSLFGFGTTESRVYVTDPSTTYFWVIETAAFQTRTHVFRPLSRRGGAAPSRLVRWSATETLSGLEGVTEFESWFNKVEKCKCDGRITHALFGRLRGLAWKGATSAASGSFASVHNSVVLQSDESQPNWDAILASKLWKEVLKGKESSLYGYICLLTQGPFDASSTDSAPPSTAPNTLRHWTLEQRDMLSTKPSGQKLIDLDARQQKDWQQKYQQLASVDRPGTLEQFTWAMEVVHSRAFRGLGQNLVSSLPGILAPIAAGVIGWAYFASSAYPNEAVLYGLGIFALLPGVFNIVSGGNKSVVLLPLIDSANHMESSASSIEFNPLSGTFELSIQPDCIVPEKDGQQQLYISYGKKGDVELLLNYGFLPGAAGAGGIDEATRDTQRQLLAKSFLARN